MTAARSGCILLADVSGYTRYLAGVELEHSHDVLADLIGVVADRLGAVVPVVKLEGDAVFCCGDGGSDLLLSAIDACYLAFARRRRTIATRTTCPCDACRRIPDLDLKFVVHHGAFVEHEVAGRREVIGPDIVLAHRLLKNSVDLRAYALLTDASIAAFAIDSQAAGMTTHFERYDDAGEVHGHVVDLAARARALEEQFPVRVAPEEAWAVITRDLAAAPAVLWDLMTDPAKQMTWRVRTDAVDGANPRGARSVGSTNHCVHGRHCFDQEIVDWQPFSYYSYTEKGPLGQLLWTLEFEPLASGSTRFKMRCKLLDGGLQRVKMRMLSGPARRTVEDSLDRLESQLREAGTEPSTAAEPVAAP